MTAHIRVVAAPAAAAPLDLATDARVRRLPARAGRPSRRLIALLWIVALAAVAGPALVVRLGPSRHVPYRVLVAIPGRIIPAAILPPVEPVAIRALTPDDARAFNAGIAFSTAANPAARPFRTVGTPDDLARATDCLAAAALYEAGDDPPGERAVAQVVLNRVRHPAFPKSVCDVVFQGSERATGCQFSFTCDGSLLRHTPTADGWARARAIATAALAGKVDPVVGHATHYHTDWVVPYWQASLDKIVAVHTQIFYRWTGWWGTPPAFDRRPAPGEPVIAALARLSDAHRPPAAMTGDPSADMGPASASASASLEAVDADGEEFLATLPAGMAPDRYPSVAASACADRPHCRFRGWADRAHTPATLPLSTDQIATMAFSYLRDRDIGMDRPLWNCRTTPRINPRDCMKRQVLLASAPTPATPAPSAGSAAPAILPLGGIRRKNDPVPPAATVPAPGH